MKKSDLKSLVKNKFIRKIFNVTFDIITITDKDLRFIYANDYFIKFSDSEKYGIIGKNVYDVLPFETAERINVDDLEVMRSGQIIKKDMMLESSKYGNRWFASRRLAIYDELGNIHVIVFTGQDITEKKAMEEKIYHEIKKSYPPTIDAVYLLGKNGEILACNDEGARRLERSQKELIGRNLNDFIQDVNTIRGMIDLTVVNTSKIRRFEDVRNSRHYDNTIYPILDNNGIIIQFVVFSHDITNRLFSKMDKEQ